MLHSHSLTEAESANRARTPRRFPRDAGGLTILPLAVLLLSSFLLLLFRGRCQLNPERVIMRRPARPPRAASARCKWGMWTVCTGGGRERECRGEERTGEPFKAAHVTAQPRLTAFSESGLVDRGVPKCVAIPSSNQAILVLFVNVGPPKNVYLSSNSCLN